MLSNKQDSSSGIESGSSHSGSGTNSPISFDQKLLQPKSEDIFAMSSSTTATAVTTATTTTSMNRNGKVQVLSKVKISGQSINTCIEIDQVRFHDTSIKPSLKSFSERTI